MRRPHTAEAGLLTSQPCTYASLTSPALLRWQEPLRPACDAAGVSHPPVVHRKLWEWLFVTEALSERGMLAPGRRGVGFGVGKEGLASLFASLGCRILATDMPAEGAEEAGWVESAQFAGSLAALNEHGVCEPERFAANVTFRTVDMRAIPSDLRGFDFAWSACAFEHLGSIDAGLRFVIAAMRCLRPGGVAVHTTEYNASSDEATVETGPTVLYRRRDLEELAVTLRRLGHGVEVDFRLGDSEADRHVDRPPFSTTHLCLDVDGHTTTSYGLIVHKGNAGAGVSAARSVLTAARARLSRAGVGRVPDRLPRDRSGRRRPR